MIIYYQHGVWNAYPHFSKVHKTDSVISELNIFNVKCEQFKYVSEQNINMETIKYLNYNDIEQLLNGISVIGVKAQFRDKLIVWRKENVMYKNTFSSC